MLDAGGICLATTEELARVLRTRVQHAAFFNLISGCGSVWLERYLREVEAACSNHVTPTNTKELISRWVLLYYMNNEMSIYVTILSN